MSKSSKNSAKKQSDFVRFMILTGLGGMLILILMFGIFYSINNGDNSNNKTNKEAEIPSTEKEGEVENIESGELEEVIGMVSKEASDHTIQIINIETEKEVSIKIETGTDMKDIYGNAMALQEFKIGDMIKTKYDKGNKVAKFFRISGETWEKKDIKDIKIYTDSQSIEIGNDIYSYSDQLITMHNDQPIALEQISSEDELILKGYQKRIWFIGVQKSHGYITVASDEEGLVEIDNNVSISIKDAKNFSVSEGTHKVVIKKEGYEPVVKNVQVEAGQNVEIDLGEMKKKIGKLGVVVKGLTDYKVFINDIEYPANEVILLEYGDYHMVVTKEGYKDWSKDFKMDSKTKTVELELEKEETQKLVKVTVDTNPPGAEVYIDDAFIGVSPIEEQVPIGEHTISLIKQGYSPIHFPITLDETKKEKQLLFTLQESAQGETDLEN